MTNKKTCLRCGESIDGPDSADGCRDPDCPVPQINELPKHRFAGSWWAEEAAIRLAITKVENGIRFEVIEQLQPYGISVEARATLTLWRCQQLIDQLRSMLENNS